MQQNTELSDLCSGSIEYILDLSAERCTDVIRATSVSRHFRNSASKDALRRWWHRHFDEQPPDDDRLTLTQYSRRCRLQSYEPLGDHPLALVEFFIEKSRADVSDLEMKMFHDEEVRYEPEAWYIWERRSRYYARLDLPVYESEAGDLDQAVVRGPFQFREDAYTTLQGLWAKNVRLWNADVFYSLLPFDEIMDSLLDSSLQNTSLGGMEETKDAVFAGFESYDWNVDQQRFIGAIGAIPAAHYNEAFRGFVELAVWPVMQTAARSMMDALWHQHKMYLMFHEGDGDDFGLKATVLKNAYNWLDETFFSGSYDEGVAAWRLMINFLKDNQFEVGEYFGVNDDDVN